jgi:ketosteroid isomerase-like protein
MSPALVAALREVYAEWARGNFRAGRELLDPDMVFETFTGDEGTVSTRGLAELEVRMRQTMELVWSDFRVEADDFIDAGDTILVTGRIVGRGRGSGVDVAGHVFMVWTFRDGLAVRQQWFQEREQALQAGGLAT